MIVSSLRNAMQRLSGFVLMHSLLGAGPAGANPEVDLHDLTWFVHVDLIDPGAYLGHRFALVGHFGGRHAGCL